MIESEIPTAPDIPNIINEQDMLVEFNELFQPGRGFASRADLRSEVTRYGQKYNIVMSTKNSNYRSIHLWCKHAGIYVQSKRKTSKKEATEKVIKTRNKATNRTGCGCFIKAKLINDMWIIEHSQGEHNHSIPNNRTVYSIHRKQSEEIKALILQLLNDGQKISNILEYLHMIGIDNIIKKDIENLQQQFRRKQKLKLKQSTTAIQEQQPFDQLLYQSPQIYTTAHENTPPSSILSSSSIKENIIE